MSLGSLLTDKRTTQVKKDREADLMARRGAPVAKTGSDRLGADKEIEKVAKKARKEDWEVTVTGGNHIKWVDPEGKTVCISGLTGATPGWVKAKNQLKKAGLHIA